MIGRFSELRLDWQAGFLAADGAVRRAQAQAYRELVKASSMHTPFNHPGWLQAAADAAEIPGTVWTLWAWQGDRLCACLPLRVMQERLGGFSLPFVRHLGYPLADRIGLMLAADAEEWLPALLARVAQRFPGHVLQFNEVVGADAGLTAYGQQSCWWFDTAVSCEVPWRAMNPADLDEATLPKEVKLELRRARRRLAEAGAEVQRLSPDRDRIDALLASCKAVEDASWKGEDAVGVFSGEGRTRWMRDAFRAWAEDGQVRALVVMQQDQVVSYRLGPFQDGVYYDYNIAFLPDMRKWGTGRLLLDEALRWAVEADWRRVDASRVSKRNSSHQLFERPHESVSHRRWTFVPRQWRLLPVWLALVVKAYIKQRKKASAPSTP